MLCIIDYGSGNISAISNICQREKIKYFVSSNYQDFKSATKFLLPGVGAFDPTMRILNSSGIMQALQENVIVQNKPILGICIGMHLLADYSEEGSSDGLGWISGSIKKIGRSSENHSNILPHMGWNEIESDCREPLLKDINLKKGFYFLHSYYFDAHATNEVIARVNYGLTMPCIVRKNNIIGAQFHPEKSHSNGVQFIKNFVELA